MMGLMGEVENGVKGMGVEEVREMVLLCEGPGWQEEGLAVVDERYGTGAERGA